MPPLNLKDFNLEWTGYPEDRTDWRDVSMSPEDAYSQMAAVTKLTVEDWRDFFACSEADQTLLIQNYKDLHGTPSISGWEKALQIGMKCVEIAGMILPIVGAVSAVYGLAIQIKNS